MKPFDATFILIYSNFFFNFLGRYKIQLFSHFGIRKKVFNKIFFMYNVHHQKLSWDTQK